MKVVLWDLGRTLEHNDVLLPGALDVLEAISRLVDGRDEPVAMGLVSDFNMPPTPEDIPAIRRSYVAILDTLGIRRYFEPTDRCVTLSSDVGAFKPDERIFRAALDRFAPDLAFSAALFVTENPAHVAAARGLGMRAVHFKGPGQETGDIVHLTDVLPLVAEFIGRPTNSGPTAGKDAPVD